MGVDCPDVRQVIHLGSPCDGRAGRDGLPALAIQKTGKEDIHE